MSQFWGKVLKTAAVAVLVTASATVASAQVAQEKVTYLFPAPDFLPAFAPFQIAKAKGYYKAEGLDVDFQIGKGGADVAKQVAVGNADLGGGIGDTSLIVRANGLTVKGVALLGGQSLTAVYVRKDSGVKSIADLKGKNIGVLAFQDTTYYNLLAVLANAGLKKDDASIQAVGAAGVVQLMIAKSLDAISGVPEWAAAIEAAGVPVERYAINDIFPAMAQAILASDKAIKERPKVVKGFVTATLKAVAEIMADPEKASKEYVAVVAQHAGKEKAIQGIMESYSKQVYAPAAGLKLGQFDSARMEKVQKFYIDNKIVETAVPIAETFTNEFVN
jgi:NitT/TauT family transport system substrate-binding protein